MDNRAYLGRLMMMMMMRPFDGTEKIGDLVAEYPGASNLLKQYQIDFCCGGERVLSAVLQQQDIDQEKFLSELNESYRQAMQKPDPEVDWRKITYNELIDHVLFHHHAYLNKELPLLSEFVTKILRVHGPHHPYLKTLHTLFHELKMELEQHLIAEETLVFPHIRDYEQTGSEDAFRKALSAIDELETEHEHAGDLLKAIRAITNQYDLPEDACHTYTLTYQKLEQLENDMFQHIHLENNILFPRLEAEA